MAHAEFRCFAGCKVAYALDDVVYRCRTCQGLLYVAHDLAALAQTPAATWRERFDARWGQAANPRASGIWEKREWVAPHVRDEHIVTFHEGKTPLQAAPRYAQGLGLSEVFIKQCGLTHTGSFKDLGMTVLVSSVKQLIADGGKVRAVACASTGDTSAALAAYAAAAGIPAIVLLPRGKISTAQLVQPLANGAHVLALDTDFDGCMAVVRELADDPTIYLANSMNSLRVEGQKTVALEIAQQLGWQVPDWVVIPGGNLGNVSALGAGFAMLNTLGLVDKLPRIAVAQAAGSAPLVASYQANWAPLQPVTAAPTMASAIQIGNPISFAKAVATLQACDGVAHAASEHAIAEAMARADRAGLYACPHTAVAMAATTALRQQGVIGAHARVVIVSTANGLKFTDTKAGYHEGRLPTLDGDAPLAYRNQPQVLAPHASAVRDAVQRICDR